MTHDYLDDRSLDAYPLRVLRAVIARGVRDHGAIVEQPTAELEAERYATSVLADVTEAEAVAESMRSYTAWEGTRA